MSKICENCKQDHASKVLNTVNLCDMCFGLEKMAIKDVHALVDRMLDRGIPAKSILERFDLYNSLQS